MEIVDKPVLLTPYSNILKNPTYFPASASATFVTGGGAKKSRKQRNKKSRKQKKNKSRKQRK